MADTYKLHVECQNCGWVGDIEIKKGKECHSVKCPHCEVKGLHTPWPHICGECQKVFVKK